MDFHEYANLFPMMSDSERAALVNDMRQTGYDADMPIVTLDGKILDGRNRYKAAKEAGVQPRYVEYSGDDPLAYVIRHNLNRRHLNESQRAVVASRLAAMRLGDNKGAHRPKEGFANLQTLNTPSQAQAAAMLNVSPRTVATVKAVEKAAPELMQKIESGEMSAHQAQKEAKKIVRKKETAQKMEQVAQAAPKVSQRYALHHCPVSDLDKLVEPASLDWIFTDPPYPKEFLNTYADLAAFADYSLKPGGSLLAMAGQSYLPEVMALLTEKLTYQWALAYITPGGQSPQIWQRKVNTFWKPVLWLVKGEYTGQWIGDVSKSGENDKRHHHWGQSESGMLDLLSRFVQPGDKVCDPFLGGGATAVAALELGCFFIGADIELSAIEATKGRLS